MRGGRRKNRLRQLIYPGLQETVNITLTYDKIDKVIFVLFCVSVQDTETVLRPLNYDKGLIALVLSFHHDCHLIHILPQRHRFQNL